MKTRFLDMLLLRLATSTSLGMEIDRSTDGVDVSAAASSGTSGRLNVLRGVR
jgi:hypothetical protein